METPIKMPVWATEIFKIRIPKDMFYREINAAFVALEYPLTHFCMWLIGLMISDTSDDTFRKLFDPRIGFFEVLSENYVKDYNTVEINNTVDEIEIECKNSGIIKRRCGVLAFHIDEIKWFIDLVYWYDFGYVYDNYKVFSDEEIELIDQCIDSLIERRNKLKSSEKLMHGLVHMILRYRENIEVYEPVLYGF